MSPVDALMPHHAKLTDLLGQTQLIAIAQIDRELALTLKVLLDLVEEADFDQARHAAECVAKKLRDLQLEFGCDATGTLLRERDVCAATSALPPGHTSCAAAPSSPRSRDLSRPSTAV